MPIVTIQCAVAETAKGRTLSKDLIATLVFLHGVYACLRPTPDCQGAYILPKNACKEKSCSMP